MAFFRKKIEAIRQDANFSRVGRDISAGFRELRASSGKTYFFRRFPIVRWVPAYVPKWIIGDVIAGLSVGMLFIPQALAYSAVAGVSVQHAVLSCWLPGIIYAVMGTSKDISTGPTLSLSLLTVEIALAIPDAGSPAVIAAALSFCVGIWSLLFGFLNFGLFWDFISLPMLLGFTSGISYIAAMTQIPALLGLDGVSPVFIDITTQVIAKLPDIKPMTFGVGATSILLLAILQFVGKRWSRGSEIIRIIAMQRILFVLILYTAISYVVNKDREEPLWAILGTTRTEVRFEVPNMQLVKTLLLSSITIWVAAAVEHVCLAKTFGRLNGYTIDQSQELVYLGVVNIANSMIGGIPVGGGDMARASVNSAAGVNSPLAGIFTSGLVMVAMYVANGLIKWIPQATIGAVVFVTVTDQMPPLSHMSKYWKISFMDWLGFLLTFNMTMLFTAETGIGLSLGATVIYTFFRLMFPAPTIIESTDLEDQYDVTSPLKWEKGARIPEGTMVISFETDVIFVNAERIKRRVLDSVMTSLSGYPLSRADRAWSNHRDKHVEYLRRKAGVNNTDTTLNPLFRVLVLDLSSTSFVDSTGMQAFEDIKAELRLYGGPEVEIRFVAMNELVQTRFKRAGWKLASPYDESQVVDDGVVDSEEGTKDLLFDHLPLAIQYQVQNRRNSGSQQIQQFDYVEGQYQPAYI